MPGPYGVVWRGTPRPKSFVHIRIRPALLFGNLHGRADLYQRTFSDSRAILSRAIPGALVFDQLRPKRKRAALGWLGGMNRAAAALQEWALLVGRLAKTHLVPCAIDILGLEGARRHTHEFGGPLEIGLGQVNEAFLIAAIDAPALAGKAYGVQALIVAYLVPQLPGSVDRVLVRSLMGPDTYRAEAGL